MMSTETNLNVSAQTNEQGSPISTCLSMIAQDPASKAMLAVAKKAAKSNATVLITGETGVGKEVLAQFIHQASGVKGPFISVNCAALPDNMIEAILFGYEKGAFTNAISSYTGKFEQAHNGTLLLDEISEISIGLQAKLLRVLQEREVERLGGKKIIPINVRIIAATNRNLIEQVKAGFFRKDLYYRLNVIPIHCVPLRQRPKDIIPLANFFLKNYAKILEREIPQLTDEAREQLIAYSWPGNVREMENVIQRALILQDANIIDEDDIQLVDNMNNQDSFHPFTSALEAQEARIILDILAESEGSRQLTAQKLNMSPRTLRYKLAKFKSLGLTIPEKMTRETL